MTAQPHRITVIPGDGVGPEVVRSAQRIIAAAGVAVDWEEAEAGAEVFKRGDTSGVPKETRASIERTRVVLKGPLETPVGFGEKSANVTLRKLFETYANVRPARELPGVPTRYAGEGLSNEEIAKAMKLSVPAVKSRVPPGAGFPAQPSSRNLLREEAVVTTEAGRGPAPPRSADG